MMYIRPRPLSTLSSSLPSRPFTCPLPVSNRAVSSLPRASLGGSSRGWGQPSSDPVSKAGGGHREGGWGRWWEVQQLQHSHAHAAAPCEHAGGCDPFVAAWVVLLDGVETWAAVITSHCIQPAVHSNKVMGAPGGRRTTKFTTFQMDGVGGVLSPFLSLYSF